MTEEEQEEQEEQEHENKRIRPRERALGQKKMGGANKSQLSPYIPPGLEYTQYLALILRAIAALLPGFFLFLQA